MAKQWSEGHSTSVLCVGASSGPEGLLASGSEGGEVTVWSQEGTVIGRLALSGEDDSTSVVFSPAAPGQLYVSHGDTVSVLDPRNLKGPVEEFQGAGEEEINALALNDTGSALAVADDSGAVRVLELPGGKVCRTLRRHTNICSSVAFRPHRPNNLLSAGLDMQVREGRTSPFVFIMSSSPVPTLQKQHDLLNFVFVTLGDAVGAAEDAPSLDPKPPGCCRGRR